jgi:hypothetical protein
MHNHKYILVFMSSTLSSCPILTIPEISDLFRYSNIKFYEIRLFSMRTDGRTWQRCRFRNFENVPESQLI